MLDGWGGWHDGLGMGVMVGTLVSLVGMGMSVVGLGLLDQVIRRRRSLTVSLSLTG